jgi:hypothetical protein
MGERPVFGGTFEARLSSGHVLTCGLERFKPWVALDDERLMLPPSEAGHGGIELVISPNEKHAAAFLYSGQSKVGYAVLETRPLRITVARYYWQGEADVPKFSPDGHWLAMLSSAPQIVRGTNQWFEEAHNPASKDIVTVYWARLYVQPIPDGEVAIVDVGSKIPLATEPDTIASWEPYQQLSWVDSETIKIGPTSCRIPASGEIVVDPPEAK